MRVSVCKHNMCVTWYFMHEEKMFLLISWTYIFGEAILAKIFI